MNFNVVADYDWTSAPRGSGMRKSAPRVYVKSYKFKSNQIMQAIQGFIAIGESSDAKSFYEKLYADATKPDDDFCFPFLSDNIRSFGNTFGDTFQSGIGGSGGIGSDSYEGMRGLIGGGAQLANMGDWKNVAGGIAEAGKLAGGGDWAGASKAARAASGSVTGGNPGTYIESPMFYQFEKNDGPLEISFVLSNTINPDSLDKNKTLIHKLTTINRPLRLNSIAVDPPRIYSVKVPGHRYIRWAYCDQFAVNMMGSRRELAGVLVPEGYQITMSFKSLTLEHAGFMEEV